MNLLVSGMGWIDHTPGGLNRYFADYLKAMQAHGHRVQGIMTAFGEKTSAPAYVRDVIAEPNRVGTLSRVKAFRNVIKQELQSGRVDLYNPHFALYASMVTRDLVPDHVPIVTNFQGPWAEESLVEDRGNEWGKRLRYQMKKNVELLSYRRSDRFIVLSEHFRDILHNDYGIADRRIHVIPGAIDHERFRPAEDRQALRRKLGLTEQMKVLFCARRLVQRMGIDRLIQAMAEVNRSFPEAVLYIAGDGALREKLNGMIGELGLRSSVFLLGRITNEQLVEWYQAADVSVVPTITLEGFGLVTVEALACGTPVLGTPYGGTKEILGKFSDRLLFADSSHEAMSAKIADVLDGSCSVPDRGACRAEVLERYTWSKVAAAITDVFQSAIDERKVLKRA